jgi:hypothetical protein
MQFGGPSIGRSRLVWILAVALASMVFAAAPATAAPPDVNKPSPPLTAEWWQRFVAISGNPLDRCDIGSGDVVFLAGTTGGSATRSCTISSRQSILVPLINVECSTAEGNGNTPAELNKCARDFADKFTNLSLVIDGAPVSDLTKFRVGSPVFTFTAAQGNVFGIPPGTTRSVADGYWALIRPLPAGTHTISFGGAYPPGNFTTNVTYTLTVR